VTTTTSASAPAPLVEVIKTRPVVKSFIPDPTVEVPGGLCDVSKLLEVFRGDARGPGVDFSSARTTAYWDFSWTTDLGSFYRRIGETTRITSIDKFAMVTGEERRRASEETIQGRPGSYYSRAGVEGFSGVDLDVATADPFCTAGSSLAVNQNIGLVGGALYAGRSPFWENDGSFGTGFRHDAYPSHEFYTYSYLPGLRFTNPMQYYFTPTSRLGPICLLATPFCPSVRVNYVNP
jgi:hypothetical protein